MVHVMESDVTITGGNFTFSQPKRVFDFEYGGSVVERAFDFTADAQKFLMLEETYPAAETAPREIQIIQNWFEELRRLSPAP